MLKFKITFKVNGKIQEWERFAMNEDQATASAESALDAEYFGDATLISVEEIHNPQNEFDNMIFDDIWGG